MKSKFALTTLAAVAALGFGVSQAPAALVMSDSFSYADGDLTDYQDQALNPGDNVSGGLWDDHSGGGFLPRIVVSNGKALLENPGSEDANRSFAPLGAADTLYYATRFVVTDNTNGGPTGNVNDDYFIHFGTDFVARLSINDSVSGDFEFGVQSGSSFALSGASDGVGRSFGTEYIAVVKWDNATGTATAWINPTSEASPSFGGIADGTRIGATVNNLSLRQDFFSTSGVDHNIVAVDDVAVATTFSEALAAVPEPASVGLVALGGLAMLRRKA